MKYPLSHVSTLRVAILVTHDTCLFNRLDVISRLNSVTVVDLIFMELKNNEYNDTEKANLTFLIICVQFCVMYVDNLCVECIREAIEEMNHVISFLTDISLYSAHISDKQTLGTIVWLC